jgi:EpsI family protein
MQPLKSNNWRFWTLLIGLILGGIVINIWEFVGEAHVDRKPLKDFPQAVGAWQQMGPDQRFDAETEAVLRADDYLSRTYKANDVGIASFYVGYYVSQRSGSTYHSPLNCLPGSGWTMSNPETIKITPSDGSPTFEANQYVIHNSNDKQVLLYWYQGRGRAIASEYWGKVYTVIDSIKRRRSDGAMVRVLVPINQSESSSLEAAKDFAAQAAPLLSSYIPE